MLRICEHPDCTTLTLGDLCMAHEVRVVEERFPRGRPFPAAASRRRLEVAEVPRPPQVRAVSFRGGS